MVDNGSTDGSLELLAERGVRTIELGRNTGFAFACNRGIEAAETELVALVNTDVVLAPDWLERMMAALEADPGAASAACKMVDLRDPGVIWDAGDFLRRDGAAEQRGRGRARRRALRRARRGRSRPARGRRVYRRAAVLDGGRLRRALLRLPRGRGPGLRLRLAGWTCRYEPAAVARHAGGGSSGALRRPMLGWVERNTLLLLREVLPAALGAVRALPPARVGLARGARRMAGRAPGGSARRPAAAARDAERPPPPAPRGAGADRRGDTAAADHAPRRRHQASIDSPAMPQQPPPLRVLLGIALIAGGTLALQVLLTRLFSAVLFYHFGFLAISLALLGIGAGALVIYVRPGIVDRSPVERLLAWSAGAFGLLLPARDARARPARLHVHRGDGRVRVQARPRLPARDPSVPGGGRDAGGRDPLVHAVDRARVRVRPRWRRAGRGRCRPVPVVGERAEPGGGAGSRRGAGSAPVRGPGPRPPRGARGARDRGGRERGGRRHVRLPAAPEGTGARLSSAGRRSAGSSATRSSAARDRTES